MKKEYSRNPNTFCDACNKPVYRRPSLLAKQKKVYCSQECHTKLGKQIPCPVCEKLFYPNRTRSKNCSRECANKSRTGIHYKQNNGTKQEYKNPSERNLNFLREKFNFSCCMFENCTYNRTYDIHRLIPGNLGGEYVIGNMFAICPNHHAEIHRKIIEVIKINDCTLKAIYREE